MGDRPEGEEAWDRFCDLMGKAFKPVSFDDDSITPAPDGVKKWGVDTCVVMFAGIVFGGARQLWVERNSPEVPTPSNLPTKAHIARFKAEMATRRLVRFLNGCVKGGLWLGGIGGMYYGVKGLSAYLRQQEDAYNTTFGSWAAGGLMGLSLSKSGYTNRLSSVLLGAGISALVATPFGAMEMYLLEQAEKETQKEGGELQLESEEQGNDRAYPSKGVDVVGRAVQQYESTPKRIG